MGASAPVLASAGAGAFLCYPLDMVSVVRYLRGMKNSTPQHNVCKNCGRNAHQVAVCFPDTGEVIGYCSKCWNASGPFTTQARVERRKGEVIYDTREATC